MNEIERVSYCEKKLGYIFKDKSLLVSALTHKSYAVDKKKNGINLYNERLEFLGDAILEHIVSVMLFDVKPMLSEGEMTKKRASIVCEKTLAKSMRKADLDKIIYVGKCETKKDINDAIVSDAFEAIMGAIYLDGGYQEAKNFFESMLKDYLNKAISGEEIVTDHKTKLQEILQHNGAVNIKYILKDSYGPDHEKTFITEVHLNGQKIGEGIGKNRKVSEQNAAKEALEKY